MLRLIFNLLIAIALVGFLGLIYFYSHIPSEPDKNPPQADAIIVLTGGPERIAEGVRLLSLGYADKLLISGVNQQSKLNELIETQQINESEKLMLDSSKVHLGRDAVDTVGNALEASDWVKEYEVNRIILVTSNYHMPRAYYEFRRKLPDVEIHQHAVISKKFRKEDWATDRYSRNLIILEYGKALASFFIHL